MFTKFFRRNKPQLKAVTAVTEDKLSEIFRAAPDNPLFQATLAVVDRSVEDTMERAIDVKLSSKQMRWYLGGAEALLALKQDLLDREREARVQQQEEENKKGQL